MFALSWHVDMYCTLRREPWPQPVEAHQALVLLQPSPLTRKRVRVIHY